MTRITSSGSNTRPGISLLLILTLAALFLGGCIKKHQPHDIDANPPFSARRSQGVVRDDLLHEISGIVGSRRYPGYYWVHTDSGGEPAVYLINSRAEKIAQVKISGVQNRDWEDIAIGPGTGEYSRLYISETGDNKAVHGTYYVYSFEEPGVDLDNFTQRLFIDEYTTYSFQYPDGPRDAETLMVDPLTNDLLIVSKREPEVSVYIYPAAERSAETYTLRKVCTIPFHKIVGGEISYSGKEVLLKNYLSVFYWTRDPQQSWEQVFSKAPTVLPYEPEPQGEALAFTFDGSGYVTISEAENFAAEQHLYYYARTPKPEVEAVKFN